MGGMSQRILSISQLPPLVHSLWEMDGTQLAIVIKLEISSKYLIQYILGENSGNPTLLIN